MHSRLAFEAAKLRHLAAMKNVRETLPSAERRKANQAFVPVFAVTI